MTALERWVHRQFFLGYVVKLSTIRPTTKPTAARILQRSFGGLDLRSYDPVTPNHIFAYWDEPRFNRDLPAWKLQQVAADYSGILHLTAHNPEKAVPYADGQCQFDRLLSPAVATFSLVGFVLPSMNDDD